MLNNCHFGNYYYCMFPSRDIYVPNFELQSEFKFASENLR